MRVQQHQLESIPNPRTDRTYRVTLSTDAPLPCRSVDSDESGIVQVQLHYTPQQSCIETRSFGRYLSNLLIQEPLGENVLREVLLAVRQACGPIEADITAQFVSASGIEQELAVSTPALRLA